MIDKWLWLRERVGMKDEFAWFRGKSDGWLHANLVDAYQTGGLYVAPVVPEIFAAVAKQYTDAHAAGVELYENGRYLDGTVRTPEGE